MHINIECELKTEEVIERLLESHSINYILWLIFKTYGYAEYEHLADQVTKLLEETVE